MPTSQTDFMHISPRLAKVLAASVFIISALYYLTYYNCSLNMIDEGLLVDSAARILDGQKLYRDFDHAFAPGRFYLLALLFRLFGEDFLVSRLMWVFVLSANTALIFILSSRFMPLRYAVFPALILMVVPAQWYKSFYIFFPLLGMTSLISYIRTRGIKSLIALGTVTFLGLAFRQDAGLFILVTGVITLLVCEVYEVRSGAARRYMRALAIYFITIMVLALPLLIYFGDTLGYMFYRVFYQPIFGGLQELRIPFPSLTEAVARDGIISFGAYRTLIFYVPILSYLFLAVYLAGKAVRREFGSPELGLLSMLILALMVYNKVLWESQYDHLLQSIPLAYIITAYLVWRLNGWIKARASGGGVAPRAIVTSAGIAFVIGFLLFNVFGTSGNDNGSIAARRTMKVRINSEKARVYYSDNAINDTLEYIEANTIPGDYMYVFPQSALFYFMTGRVNPTRQDFSIAGYTDARSEKEIIKSLMSKDVKLVIYDEVDTYLGVDRPERLYYKNYARNAYNYIFGNYTIVESFGRYRMMKRKSCI